MLWEHFSTAGCAGEHAYGNATYAVRMAGEYADRLLALHRAPKQAQGTLRHAACAPSGQTASWLWMFSGVLLETVVPEGSHCRVCRLTQRT